ncbi:MAG TPA: hypothetical protein VNI53_10305 [Gammaproteobacteria bacterium]|nr:hypothetical protein [Gammaproteobacteria bacterium]
MNQLNNDRDRKNIFASLMEAVKFNSLGQISHALYEVGGVPRSNMSPHAERKIF